MKKMRIYLILISFIVTTATLTLGFYAHQHYLVIQPIEKVLDTMGGIESYEINVTRKSKNIIVTMKSEQFMEDYNAIHTALNEHLSNQAFVITLKDNRDELLTTYLNDISFQLFEAIETKQYTLLQALNQDKNTTFVMKVEIDEKFIYLNLKNGDNYLYELIPRV
ncbi:hypothetical protein BHU72_08260 [Desulfuribacillus stibiiarsenatis]|uniref:Uncharacterized protein n=1 Tax=Desulfuribacillus stibiiarsenatis TaxID=1390249 RepID=A0A1E5L3Z6_9FIRM|nr:hypothetical protein [Desulfuribacillus stibiiarsenatis]OEH84816.1 hypothetical protein BHU72_08260 [Desulfuribacillus stibiiarsenatis]